MADPSNTKIGKQQLQEHLTASLGIENERDDQPVSNQHHVIEKSPFKS